MNAFEVSDVVRSQSNCENQMTPTICQTTPSSNM
jgi:hypothetical protein